MPRRTAPHPLATAVGRRVRALREAEGLTVEKLAYESDVAKGYLSDIESGRALPSLVILARLADRLGVDVVDVLVRPGTSPRHDLIALTRGLPVGVMKRLVRDIAALTESTETKRRARTRHERG